MAAKVERYKWFTYHGRPRQFQNVHANYDLSLKDGDIFGIRASKNSYKLVEASNLRILFDFPKKQIDVICKKSKGYGGKIGSVVVEKGVGGLDTHIPIVKVVEKENDIYPHVEIPITRSEAVRVFHALNKKYFDNFLKKDTRISIVNARSVSGRAVSEWAGNKIIRQTIRISKHVLTNRKRFINVLLHEMVHCKHRILFVEHDQKEYNEDHIRNGHGPKFTKEAQHLNALGFNVPEYTEDTPKDVLDIDFYVLILYNNDVYQGIYCDTPFKKQISELIDNRIAKFGHIFTHYAYGKTRSPLVTRFTKLTTQFKINRKEKDIRYLLCPEIRSLIKELPKKIILTEDSLSVSQELIKFLPSAQKLRASGFTTFAVNVMYNIPSYRNKIGDWKDIKQEKENIVKQLSEADHKYLYDFWKKTTFDMLMKDKYFKQDVKTICEQVFSLLKNKDSSSSRVTYALTLSSARTNILNTFKFYLENRKSYNDYIFFLMERCSDYHTADEIYEIFQKITKI